MAIKVYRKTFDNATGAVIIAPAVAGRIYNVVALSVTNNELITENAARVRIAKNFTDLYGGGSLGAIYLSGRGDHFFLPFKVSDPYFSTDANNTLYIFSVYNRHIAGIIYYTITDE